MTASTSGHLFGHDFSRVRVHTGAAADRAARALHARAFTIGNDVAFRHGAYAPGSAAGRGLLLHELTHVMEQGRVPPGTIMKAADPAVEGPDLEQLLQQIDERTAQNLELRQQIDALPPASSQQRDTLSQQLDAGRMELVGLLQKRILQLKEAIAEQENIFATPTMSSGQDDAVAQRTFFNRDRYARQLKEHENQLRVLQRWQSRRTIAVIDVEAMLPATPETRKTALGGTRKTLVQSMLSGAVEYKQGDPRWGSTKYGAAEGCTDVATAGCGPTSLAILLNYLYAEDPESLKPGPIEFVTPAETVPYAATHGRICNSGTSETMVTQLETQWPGYRGKAIGLDEAVTQLRSANPVIFLCKSCSGKDASGKTRSYAGHYMVLNGVDDDGTTFDVLDPATKDIATITKSELQSHTGDPHGFWIVERK